MFLWSGSGWSLQFCASTCLALGFTERFRHVPTASSKVPWHIIIIPTLWYPCFFATAARGGLGEFAVLYNKFHAQSYTRLLHRFHIPSAGMWGCANVSVLANIFDILFDANYVPYSFFAWFHIPSVGVGGVATSLSSLLTSLMLRSPRLLYLIAHTFGWCGGVW